MLDRAAASLPALDRLARKPFPVFLEPPSLDDRIVNQFALFSLMSSPRAQMDDWLIHHRHLYNEIVIPSSLKWEVRDKLDQAKHHRTRAVSRSRWNQPMAETLLQSADDLPAAAREPPAHQIAAARRPGDEVLDDGNGSRRRRRR